MLIQNLVFYFFSALLLSSAVMVICARNTVHGVLFLVLAFFASSVLWILLQAEFLALVLIFVYVGAVMTLFLFVVMMLNIDRETVQEGFVRFVPVALVIIVLLVAMMILVIGPKHFDLAHFAQPIVYDSNYSNVKSLGAVLYTDYVFAFELAAVMLLVAIISAISLAYRGRQNSKSQKISEQLQAQPKNRLRIVKMKSES